MILLIDNYDSFAHNLARYLMRLGPQVTVVRNDQVRLPDVRAMRPQAIVLSPGPRTPQEAGCSLELVRGCWHDLPILGICLGHQTIAAAFGARIIRAPYPMHGKTSRVVHDGQGVFAGAPNPLTACRYHSLVVDRASVEAPLAVTAATRDGVVMALRHALRPVIGLQFHPEAILTEFGYGLLANFLRMAGVSVSGLCPQRADEILVRPDHAPDLPRVPVTF